MYSPTWGGYGNNRKYITARLRRDGFRRLADCIDAGTLSAQFAKKIVENIPAEHIDAVTDVAEYYGPRQPECWNWNVTDILALKDYMRKNA
jgi:hypothetical protein